MAGHGHEADFADDSGDDDNSILSTKGLETFSRKVTTTASHLMGPPTVDSPHVDHYRSAMTAVHKQLQKPSVQHGIFSMAKTTPSELVRSKLSRTEIQHRALTALSDEMLANIPYAENSYSLFQGFQASFPEMTEDGKKHRRKPSRGRKLLDESAHAPASPQSLSKLKRQKGSMMHELQLLTIRKNMASYEIRDIDNKLANLAGMRRTVLERLSRIEQDEAVLEQDIVDTENRIEETQQLVNENEAAAGRQAPAADDDDLDESLIILGHDDVDFMSQSIYEKIPSAQTTPTKRKKPKAPRRKSMPILHEHFEPGSMIREIRAHKEPVLAMDFDAPFGTMVTSSMDDTVRVWDLNAGRCIGLLEGHTASVRTLQVSDNFLATGSADATIRLWDLSKARYDPQGSGFSGGEDDEDGIAFSRDDDQPVDPPEGTMDDCPLFTLQAHLDEITALDFRGDVLVSGSADKTLRQWDLEKGRCVQTLDVMWAAAQASASLGASAMPGGGGGNWRHTARSSDGGADFVGALQLFDAALACGTADGMVRLWDLRSGQVHRSLVGHTGPVTCLQFDDVHLVTGSVDRSIRIWDLRTGAIHDAYAYDNPVTAMMFDARRIACAAGEDVVKVYDKVEGRQWDCGAGIAAAEEGRTPSIVERVRLKDGYLVEGRRDGIVGVWAC
ncbi:related to CAF4 protein [Cephalotrichum gorgonifer]|uniref:Mitochondrial division protein 1 n=1 Tax=Cephalotrichum gorgonifer TaxID=2041049 RepID=A0AAE8SYH2_9PEZI|nr:related to CAF4 protein [Cephalotrichum gorgonifer]